MKRWGSQAYRCYHGMKSRIRRDRTYENISIHPRWLESYDNFLEDMGPTEKGFTLDRIDPSGNYEPSNCRWIHKSCQSRTTKRYLAIKQCHVCNDRRGNRRGRCHRCSEYFRRNKKEWPGVEEAKRLNREAIINAKQKPVEAVNDKGEIVYQFKSASAADKALGMSNGCINHCVKGRVKKSAGLRWRIKE
jgi:hypothetical protein